MGVLNIQTYYAFPFSFYTEATYTAATGLSTAPYLHRWLLITGALFACSALVYGYRLWRTRSSAVMTPSHASSDDAER